MLLLLTDDISIPRFKRAGNGVRSDAATETSKCMRELSMGMLDVRIAAEYADAAESTKQRTHVIQRASAFRINRTGGRAADVRCIKKNQCHMLSGAPALS
jgi:hypothetical protein